MENNNNLIWIFLALVVLVLVVVFATKNRKYTPPAGTQPAQGEQAPATTASSDTTKPAASDVVRYFADEKVVNADIMALQQALNVSASGVNKYKLTPIIADGKLGDKTATEIGKVNATIGNAVKSARLITKAQMRSIIDILNA